MTIPRFSRDFWLGAVINLAFVAVAAFIVFHATV